MLKKSVTFALFFLNLSSYAQDIIPLKECSFVLRDQTNIIRFFKEVDDEKRMACHKASQRCENTLLSMRSYGRRRQNLVCVQQIKEREQEQICAVSLRSKRGDILASFVGKHYDFARACEDGNRQCQEQLSLRYINGLNLLAYCTTDTVVPIPPVIERPAPPAAVAVVAQCEYQYSFRSYHNGYYQTQTKNVSASANDLSLESARARACSFALNLCENHRISSGSMTSCTFVRHF